MVLAIAHYSRRPDLMDRPHAVAERQGGDVVHEAGPPCAARVESGTAQGRLVCQAWYWLTQRASVSIWYAQGPVMPVDLPAGIEQGTVSTRIRSEVGRRALPAVGLGERVVAGDRSAHHHRWNDTFARVNVAYLAGATCARLDVLAAGVATE